MRFPLFLLLTACGPPDEEPLAVDPLELVTSLGPFTPGYMEHELTYTEPTSGEPRTLRLALWYPSTETVGAEARYMGVFEAPGVLDEVTPAASVGTAVFSHGHQGYAENSGFLMAHLASHGLIVASPDHTGNTTFDGDNRDTEIYFQRSYDISAVLDFLPSIAELDADAEAVLGIGHSFGSYTLHNLVGASFDPDLPADCVAGTGPSPFCSTWDDAFTDVFASGFTDPRIAAAVSMAAGDFDLYGAEGIADIAVPTLVMTGEHDSHTADTGEPMWSVLEGGEHRRVHILGGGHQTYTDFAGTLSDGSTIDPDEGKRITAAYTLAWYLRQLENDPALDAILDGDVAVSAEAQLSR
jgi:predicted dienelactone hydrolase